MTTVIMGMGVKIAPSLQLHHRHLLHRPNPNAAAAAGYRENRLIAFTTPPNYAERLSNLLLLKGWHPLWCPTVVVETTPLTTASIRRFLSPASNSNPSSNGNSKSPLQDFSAIAFTSRTGINAFSEALSDVPEPPLAPTGEIFTISALGKDAELLDPVFVNRICQNSERIRILVPPVATPAGLAESLGPGKRRRVLCPVPIVIGLEEPPVVPNFLRDLAAKEWVPVRVSSYETRWAGPDCAAEVASSERLDAVIFTSTAEVEGLLKSLRGYGLDWVAVRARFPRLVVAAHGPVTAAGAEKLGVAIDVVSSRFESFEGVVSALESRWQGDYL